MSRRILLVDDDPSMRETLEFVLDRHGFEVRAVESAEAAINAIRGFRPAVLLTDLHMPGMSGLELMRVVRGAEVDVEVIIVTGQEDMESAVTSIRDGAYDYLTKPVDGSELLDLLDRCFRDRSTRLRLERGGQEDGRSARERLVGSSPRMIEIYKTIGRVAPTAAPVLIRGETGSGKEMVARAIHVHSDRSDEPFVAVNCTAIPDQLLESELFGHVRGAFTGAVSDRKGRFELAGDGTIFLDEIGDTSPAFQAKLLRVLQAREFFPVGSETGRRTNARVLAATHRPIETLVRKGEFREDLFFRLRVVEILVPPLRERLEDIPRLAEHFLAKASRELRRPPRIIPPEVMRRLQEHAWPGNVRELENAISRAVVLAQGAVLQGEHLGIGGTDEPAAALPSPTSLDEAERRQVIEVLERTGGNKRQSARILGVSRPRLDRLVQKYGIEVEAFAHRA